MRFLKRSIMQRLAGHCITEKPVNNRCWKVIGNSIEVNIAEAPELSQPSGALRLEGKGLDRRVLIIRGEDGEFHAFPNHCTHTGRRLDPVPGEHMVQCCGLGKSTFDYKGSVLYGVESTSIQPFRLRRDADVLTVELGG